MPKISNLHFLNPKRRFRGIKTNWYITPWLLKGALATAATATPQTMLAGFTPFKSDSLQVWSCGGLSEAFNELNAIYESRTGHNIQYTGAFAGALGKSLLALQSTTELFGARVLELSKKLRKAGLSLHFRPLCFTDYVLVVPKATLQAFVT